MEPQGHYQFIITNEGYAILDNVFYEVSRLMDEVRYEDIKERFYSLAKDNLLNRMALSVSIRQLFRIVDDTLLINHLQPMMNEIREVYEVNNTSEREMSIMKLSIDINREHDLLFKYPGCCDKPIEPNPLLDYIKEVAESYNDPKFNILVDKFVDKLGYINPDRRLTTEESEENGNSIYKRRI